jgi:hypothetical protein
MECGKILSLILIIPKGFQGFCIESNSLNNFGRECGKILSLILPMFKGFVAMATS